MLLKKKKIIIVGICLVVVAIIIAVVVQYLRNEELKDYDGTLVRMEYMTDEI